MARHNHSYYNSYTQYLTPPPIQLSFFIFVVLVFLAFTWYINFESMFQDLMDQLKLMLMLCPVLLLLLVKWLSNHDQHGRVSLALPLPAEQDSIHRAGGSPWGVGLLLVFLMFMISYQTSIHERWFPLLSR